MKNITLDLQINKQEINTDIESIAPLKNFEQAHAYDVANTTITAVVVAPEAKKYRLVLAADVEAGTLAQVQVASSDESVKKPAKFKRIPKSQASILKPVLEKAGIVLDSEHSEKTQLQELVKYYKVADIDIPAGQHVLRIHASQKLHPVDGNAKSYSYVMYAPQLSFNPSANVRLAATVVFPLDFEQLADIAEPKVEGLPGQPNPNQIAYTNPLLGLQKAYGWAFQSDPKITISYKYK